MGCVIMNPRPMSEEERRELFKPPADRFDARWLEIPAFLRRPSVATEGSTAFEGFQEID